MRCPLPLQVDASDFSEIATTCTEGRCVLDLCVDAADAFIGVVSVEPNELMSSSARVYEVGRRRIQVARLAQKIVHALNPGACLVCRSPKNLTSCSGRVHETAPQRLRLCKRLLESHLDGIA